MKGAGNTNTFPLLHGAATALVLVLTCIGVACQLTEISRRKPSSSTERVLQCEFTDLTGSEWDVKNARFYRNGTNIINLAPEYEEDRERGIITFEMTQELEGKYTCDNESVLLSFNHLLVVASPTVDMSIPQYYVQSVGDSVEMMCGVKQGPLASLYVAEWHREGVFSDVKSILRERAEVKREELQDFSLTISSLELTDSGKYHCQVTIEPEKGNSPLQSNIELLIYQSPAISFLSTDQLHIISPSDPNPPSVMFICNASGSPNLSIRWSRNGRIIPPDSRDFSVENKTSVEEGLTSVQSVLQAKDPKLADSGKITCHASIGYREEENGEMGEFSVFSHIQCRDLTVLDSSLEPRPYATQDGDLLVRMDLNSEVMLPGVTQIRLRTIPDSSGEDPLEFPVDDVFFEGSRFYAFVPASQLKFRQFYIQVALVVNGTTGPYSPAEVTENQYVDYDADEIQLKYIVLTISCALVLFVAAICITCVIIYKIYDKTHSCDNVLKFIKCQLKKELSKDSFNADVYNDFQKMLHEIVKAKIKIAEIRAQSWCCCRRRNQAGHFAEDGGLVAKDGAIIDSNTSPEEGKRRLLELIHSIDQELKYGQLSCRTTARV